MAIAADALFISNRLVYGLAKSNANILDRMVRINVQIARGLNFQINHPMAGNLIQHMLKKSHARVETPEAASVQIQPDLDLSLQGIALYFGYAICHFNCNRLGNS